MPSDSSRWSDTRHSKQSALPRSARPYTASEVQCTPLMAGANLYDLRGQEKRILYYPEGKGAMPGVEQSGPILIYDDGSSRMECSGARLKVGHENWAGTVVTALIRTNGIVPGAVTSLVVLIPDISPLPTDGSVAVHTIAVLANHRGTPMAGPGQLKTDTEFAVDGTAVLKKLPL